ncbi:hypothetical protein GOODEAATRI_022322 [Goodea atripinnis]|uniref:Teneurin N-terminal domain-containing protein n=1 Tax=Goodea atripinnis TaxID=208336 RepID=A0ABV0PQS0_9TELE
MQTTWPIFRQFAVKGHGALRAMEEMDSKPYQPLSKGRHEMEMSYTSSSDESEDGRTHHRSYTSRETLPDYTHELRLTLGSHRDRQSNYSQPQPGSRLLLTNAQEGIHARCDSQYQEILGL